MFNKFFSISTPIKYLPDIRIKNGQEKEFSASWKKFWKKYPKDLNTREKRFNAFVDRLNKEGDERYTRRVSIRFIDKNVGYGVFAKEDIPPYSLLHHYAGVLTHDDDITLKNDSAFSFSDFDDFCIDATQEGNWTRFMNHADEEKGFTNVLAWEFYRADAPRIVFTAGSKRIKKGQQLLYTYGDDYWENREFKPL